MERILSFVDRDFLLTCLAGTPLDVSVFNNEQASRAAVLMVHCVLNGPVGVNKHTNFPNRLIGSVKSLLGIPNMSNKNWQNTCQTFATELKNQYPDICAQSQQHAIHGDVWPLHGRPGNVP